MGESSANFYITTPIYYVNGRPHIGHAYTTIAADTAARYQKMKGRSVQFLTGTDEHGQKVLEKANERNMTPRAHCDDMVASWRAAWQKLNVDCSRFIRTTDADHEALVTSVLASLFEKGLIYRGEYEGWYSVTDEVFVTDIEVAEGRDTSDLQRITEVNYFFKMGSYQQQLLDYIEANPDYIQPKSRRNEVLGFLKKELGDLCISRPKSRMAWGIELPFDNDFVTYVWFDALLNYLTGIGYSLDNDGSYEAWWPADFCLIGKDILTTHAVYFSTILMALELPLPKTLFAHGWWVSSDGEKMSKSKGNAIDIDLLVDHFGVDAVRYFLMREVTFGADAKFSYRGFLLRYNADLANDLGNLAHRAITMTIRWHGATPEMGAYTELEEQLLALSRTVIADFDNAMERLAYQKALQAVWLLVEAANKYIDTTAPWALNKNGEHGRLATVMRMVLEVVHLIAVLMSAVMPERSTTLLRRVGAVAEPDVYLQRLLAGGEPLQALEVGTSVDLGDPLFPRFKELPEAIAALFQSDEPSQKPVKEKSKAKEPVVKDESKSSDEPDGLINFDDFMKIQLRAGKVLAAETHPNADRLLVLQVDVGEDEPRNIVAGIATKFTPAELVGRSVVVVCNLKPAKLRGVMSQGMLLAAGEKAVVDLVGVNAEPGTVVR